MGSRRGSEHTPEHGVWAGELPLLDQLLARLGLVRLSHASNVPKSCEIDETMLRAGRQELCGYDPDSDSGTDLLKRVYVAMRSAIKTQR